MKRCTKLCLWGILAVLPDSLEAAPKIDLDAVWQCTVNESSDQGVTKGTTTRKFSLREVAEHGMIGLSQGPGISLYSSLETYNVGSNGDFGYLVLATKPTEQKELHGSIFISARGKDQISLDISVFQTTRVYDPANGWPVFILKKAPKVYKLTCGGGGA